MNKVAVIFDRLGPYHWARLEAASRTHQVIAIELRAETDEYQWAKIDRTGNFERVVLFSGAESKNASLSSAIGRKLLISALNAAAPTAVLIPGWSTAASLVALQWCRRAAVPAILMSESTALDENRHWLRELIKRRIMRLFSAALVGGKPQVDYLVDLGMSREKVFTGYDAVDNEYFATRANEVRGQSLETRKTYALPQNYFLASARFIEKKNLFGLLRAFAEYRQGTGATAWHLVLLGDGPLKPSLCDMIEKLSLKDSVLLPGFRQYEELPEYYALAKAFVHASTSEQWGLVVNEAMASGLPVLVSNMSGCAVDLVRDGQNGWTFDPQDDVELARRMHEMSTFGDARLLEMGEASKRIIAEYSPAAFAEGMHRAVEASANRLNRLRSKIEGLLLELLLKFR